MILDAVSGPCFLLYQMGAYSKLTYRIGNLLLAVGWAFKSPREGIRANLFSVYKKPICSNLHIRRIKSSGSTSSSVRRMCCRYLHR